MQIVIAIIAVLLIAMVINIKSTRDYKEASIMTCEVTHKANYFSGGRTASGKSAIISTTCGQLQVKKIHKFNEKLSREMFETIEIGKTYEFKIMSKRNYIINLVPLNS